MIYSIKCTIDGSLSFLPSIIKIRKLNFIFISNEKKNLILDSYKEMKSEEGRQCSIQNQFHPFFSSMMPRRKTSNQQKGVQSA